jgi:uncharacterized protein (UPF0332 family)
MTAEDRHPTIEAWLANADQALTDAALLLANQSLTGTLNRCYYAMFYAASALVIRDGGILHKHTAVISHVHREYVKTGRLSKEMGRAILTAFDRRQEADYHVMVRSSLEEVSELVDQARRFVAEVKSFLHCAE